MKVPATSFSYSLFASIMFLAACSVVAAILTAMHPPHLGVPIQARMKLQSAGQQVVIDDFDLIPEPSDFSRFQDFERFYERQGVIANVISHEPLTIVKEGPDEVIEKRPHRIHDLTFLFWIQVLVGVSCFVISGGVWSAKVGDLARFCFFAAGFCIWLACLSSAIYTTRELALPENIFRTLGFLNAIGGGCFGMTIIALFLTHPVRIPFWKLGIFLEVVFFGSWLSLFLFRITWVNVNLSIVMQLVLVCGMIAWQFWMTRRRPMARAALTWLGLSMIFGGGAFVVFNTVPVILELPALNQGYAFLFLIIIFFGLAAGLTDFQLYHVGPWIFRGLFLLSALVTFALVDAGFVYVLGMNHWSAVVLSLVLMALICMPMRDSLRRYLRKKAKN